MLAKKKKKKNNNRPNNDARLLSEMLLSQTESCSGFSFRPAPTSYASSVITCSEIVNSEKNKHCISL